MQICYSSIISSERVTMLVGRASRSALPRKHLDNVAKILVRLNSYRDAYI